VASEEEELLSGQRIAVVRGGEWNATPDVPRTLDVIRRLGGRPTVICWDKSGRGLSREVVEGCDVLRFRKHIPARNAILFAWWPAWWAWLLRQLIAGRYDLVHAIDLEAMIPAAIGKCLGGYRLVYDCRDSLGLVLSNVRAPVPQAFAAMERLFLPAADGMLLTQGALDVCAAYFGRRATRCIPIVQVMNVPPVRTLPAHFRRPTARPLRVLVSGYISPRRGAYLLTDHFANREDVIFDVVGDIRYPDIISRFKSMRNVTFYGLVPYARSLELTDQCDLVWLHYDVSLRNVAIATSNKMFEGMMYGKPYVTSEGSWMGDIAKRLKMGWALPYGDTAGLDLLWRQLNERPELLVQAGLNARAAVERGFNWVLQSGNQVALYRHVLGRPSSSQACQGWRRFLGVAAEASVCGSLR
jgi:glycosyltransferase involved in cell wall biosynthesis